MFYTIFPTPTFGIWLNTKRGINILKHKEQKYWSVVCQNPGGISMDRIKTKYRQIKNILKDF